MRTLLHRSRLARLLLSLLLGTTPPMLVDAQATPAPTAAPPTDSGGAPVVVAGDTLFVLHARIGAFTPADRADGVMQRAAALARTISRGTDSIVVVEAETHTDLVVGETVLMTVLDGDARPLGVSRADLAAQWALELSGGMLAQAKRTSWQTILLGVFFALLATGALVLLLKGLAAVFPRLLTKVDGWRGTVMPALRIQRLEVLSSARLTDFLIGVIRTARVVLTVVVLYFYVPLVLRFFPWTESLADRIVDYVVQPLERAGSAFVDYLPNVFFIVVIAFLTRYVLKFVHLFFDAIREGTVEFPGFYREWAEPSYKIVRFMILAFVVVVVFPYLPGAGSDAFQGVSIFLGALFTLGSSSAIANIVAGVVLTFTRAFQVGDRVKIGDTTGDVMEKSLLVTRVRTIKNVDITVPNAIVMSSHIINYSARADESGVILHTGVTIGYDVPWRQVHALLLEAAASTEGVRREPKAFVLQTSLDDFYVSYQLNAYSANPKAMARTYSDLHQNIQDAFNKAGVEILSPHYRAARDGNEITIPPDQRPAGYTAPGFRVQQLRPDGDG
jgi:small-conductance mechanosensitive channel